MAARKRKRGTPKPGGKKDQRMKGRGAKPGPKKGSKNRKPGTPGYTGKK